MPSLGWRLGTKVALGRSRHVLRAPEKHAQQEKRNWSYPSVANDSDIPDLHIPKWHTDQPCQTDDSTGNHLLPYRKFVRIWHDGRRIGW